MNTAVESLTGWTTSAAVRRPLDAVFSIVNESPRETIENPVTSDLKGGVINQWAFRVWRHERRTLGFKEALCAAGLAARFS